LFVRHGLPVPCRLALVCVMGLQIPAFAVVFHPHVGNGLLVLVADLRQAFAVAAQGRFIPTRLLKEGRSVFAGQADQLFPPRRLLDLLMKGDEGLLALRQVVMLQQVLFGMIKPSAVTVGHLMAFLLQAFFQGAETGLGNMLEGCPAALFRFIGGAVR